MGPGAVGGDGKADSIVGGRFELRGGGQLTILSPVGARSLSWVSICLLLRSVSPYNSMGPPSPLGEPSL